MGDGMPYQLEKGALLRIFEKHLNGDRAKLELILDVLRDSERRDSADWVVSALPALWSDSDFRPTGDWSGEAKRADLLEEWFGYEEVSPGTWQPAQPKPGDAPKATTGYWIGYRGDVATIVRRTLLWAVELALQVGSDRAEQHPEPWPIELYWKCPENWFEGWVLSRRIPTTDAGLVTVIFVTPGHTGGEVATSPVATSAKANIKPRRAVPSWQVDYELLTFDRPLPERFPVSAKYHAAGVEAKPRREARERDHAMWVVTHREHVILGEDDARLEQEGDLERRARQTNTASARPLGEFFEIPQLAEYAGTGDVVVVSPSMAAGGVTHDGKVV
jgi:hypothetical protein